MQRKREFAGFRPLITAGLLGVTVASLTGCQVDYGGQTLPSSHYLMDDVQYFSAGPEMMLSSEVSALEEHDATRRTLP